MPQRSPSRLWDQLGAACEPLLQFHKVSSAPAVASDALSERRSFASTNFEPVSSKLQASEVLSCLGKAWRQKRADRLQGLHGTHRAAGTSSKWQIHIAVSDALQ